MTDAVVLTGAGMGSAAAYEVGVLDALIGRGCAATHDRPIAPEIYSGSVFGAFNAAVMAAGEEAPTTVERLARIWIDEISGDAGPLAPLGVPPRNGIFRVRGDPRELIEPGGPRQLVEDFAYLSWRMLARTSRFLSSGAPLLRRLAEVPDLSDFVSVEPYRRLVRRHVDLDGLRARGREIRVVATDWLNGRVRTFDQNDLSHEALMASAAVFALFPRPEIDDLRFAGGGIGMPTPFAPALEAGLARGGERLELHVVFLNPELSTIPEPSLPSTFSTVTRLTYFAQLTGLAARLDETVRNELTRLSAPRSPAVTVHAYRPREPLWDVFSVLDFDRAKTRRLIAQGRRDALEHDCAAAGCVVP